MARDSPTHHLTALARKLRKLRVIVIKVYVAHTV